MSSPHVTILVLNWNGLEETLECLSSLQTLSYPNYKVVVIDNGSEDGSVSTIHQHYPNITLLETGKNLGYAGGNNLGIEYALSHNAEYILILNNDTVTASDLITQLVSFAASNTGKIIMGPKIYLHDQPDVLWFAGGRWRPDKLEFEHIGSGEVDGPDYSASIECDYITGCALFAHADAFRDIGLLDHKLYLTYEETDWCYRARKKGYRCLVVPEAKVWHKVSASFGGATSPLMTYFMVRNRLLWAGRHLPWSQKLALHKLSWVFVKKILDQGLHIGKSNAPMYKRIIWAFSHWFAQVNLAVNIPTNKAALMGLRDFYLRRFGNCSDEIRALNNKKDQG